VLRIHAEAGRAGELNRAAAAAGFTLAHLVVGQDSLEDIFLAMTGTSDGELAAGRAAAVATRGATRPAADTTMEEVA
jgi:hypothetical protein